MASFAVLCVLRLSVDGAAVRRGDPPGGADVPWPQFLGGHHLVQAEQ